MRFFKGFQGNFLIVFWRSLRLSDNLQLLFRLFLKHLLHFHIWDGDLSRRILIHWLFRDFCKASFQLFIKPLSGQEVKLALTFTFIGHQLQLFLCLFLLFPGVEQRDNGRNVPFVGFLLILYHFKKFHLCIYGGTCCILDSFVIPLFLIVNIANLWQENGLRSVGLLPVLILDCG